MSKKDEKKVEWKSDDKLTMIITKGANSKSDKGLTMNFQEVNQKKKEQKK